MDRDKNLLFGVLAAQLRRVTSSSLVGAAAAWIADPQKELAQHLIDLGALDDAGLRLVGGVLEVIIREHGGSSEAALVSLGGVEQIHQAFEGRIVLTSSGGVTLGPAEPDVRELSDSAVTPGVRETPGRYTHPSLYASGGMGRVLLVHDEHLGRDIALKELLPRWTTESPTLQPGTPMRMAMPQIVRFLQEARFTGQLEHPAIVPVYEVGHRTDGTLYYTMKLVRGKNLRKAIRDAASLRERLQLVAHLQDLCQAIAYAHSRGVIHRDIKPANVMVGEFGETVVIDWGLAKAKNREDIHAGEMAETARLMRQGERPPAAQTVYGDVVGTPDYMPPEQARGDIGAIDERSDVYSLGAVLYELLTGRPPFEAADVNVIVQRVINEAPPSVLSCEPDAPRELAAICERAMRKDPDQRYQSAKELADDMQRFLSGAMVQAYAYSFSEYLRRFVRKHKAILATAAAGLALLLATGIVYNVQLIVARNNEHAQRIAAEAANQRLVWENYSVTLGAVQRHIDDRRTGRALALLDQSPPEHRNWEWGRLKRECQPEIWQLYDSDTGDNTYGMPVRILLSPNQRYVLCHRFHSGLKHVFDLQTGKNIYVEMAGAYTGWPDCTQFAPDSRRFATAVDARHVGLWDFVEKRQVAVFESEKGEIHSVAFSPDGRLLAGYVVDDTQTPEIVLWDTASAAALKRFPLDRIEGALQDDPGPSGTSARYFGHLQGSVLGFFPDSVRVAFTDNRLGVLNTGTGERTYAGPSHRLARFAPASGIAATCALSGAVQIWDLNTNVKVSTLEKAPQLPRDMALSPDGKLLVTSSGRLQKWDTASGKLLYETPHGVFSINFSANGNVFTCLEEHTFQIWDTKAALDTEYPRFHKDAGTPDSTELFFDFGKQPAYAYNPQCTELACGDRDGNLMFWSVPDFKRIRTWSTGGGRINSVAYSADGRRVVSAAAQKVQVWDIATGAVLLTVPPRAGDSMTCAALSPDGARLAVASYKTGGRSDEGSDQVWVVDAITGERIYTVSGHPYSANYVRFSPDGQWLLTGTYGATEVDTDASIRIWDAATGTRLAGSITSMNWPWHASFSPDNTKMLVLGLSLEPVLWDLVEQREVYRLKGAGAFQVLFHPNGERFVVIDGNGVRVHAVSDGRELITLDRGRVSLIDPPGGGIPAAFTPDGRELICRRDGSTMIRFKTADWTTPDRKTEFAQGLDEVRRLLALPK